MSTSSTEGQGQESAQGQGNQGQESGSEEGGQGQESAAGGTSQFDISTVQDPTVRAYLEQVQRDATEARNQAARYRTERNGLQTQVEEFTRANETAVQRQEREAAERQAETDRLRQENRDLKVGAVVRAKATTARAFNPDTVYRMIADRIQTGEDGQPANVDDLMRDLRKSDPYLFRREGGADAGQGREDEDGNALSMNDQLRRAAGKS
jgi:hypothetical protein